LKLELKSCFEAFINEVDLLLNWRLPTLELFFIELLLQVFVWKNLYLKWRRFYYLVLSFDELRLDVLLRFKGEDVFAANLF
jgi:hypothetical protein